MTAMRRVEGASALWSGSGEGPRKRRSIGPTLGDKALPQVTSRNQASSLLAEKGPMPVWMSGVPTPFTRGACRTGTENEQGRAGSESARLAELVATVTRSRASSNPSELLPPLAELRRVLSTQLTLPIQQVLDMGGLPPLLSFLNAESPAIQLEAAWAITNIAGGSSEHAAAVVEAGGLPALFSAMQSPSVPKRADLCSQLLWVLGNIAGDEDVRLRDTLLEADVVGHMGQLFAQIPGFTWDSHGRTQVLRTLTWLMSCLCGGHPAPKLEQVDCAFDYFAQVVTGTDDAEMLSEALWGLHHLLDGALSEEDGDARVARMLSAGFGPGEAPPPDVPHPVVVQVVASLASSGDRRSPIVDPAMKILGALTSTCHPDTTDLAITAGTLKALRHVLADVRSPAELRGNAAWVLSNIAAGSSLQARKLLDEPGTYDALCAALERGPTHEVRCECAWAVANLASQGVPILSCMDGRELLRLLIVALTTATDPALQRTLLDAVEATISQPAFRGLSENPLAKVAEGLGFMEMLEDLQQSQSEGIHAKAAHLLESMFGAGYHKEAPITASVKPMVLSSCKSSVTTPFGIHSGSPARPGYMFGA